MQAKRALTKVWFLGVIAGLAGVAFAAIGLASFGKEGQTLNSEQAGVHVVPQPSVEEILSRPITAKNYHATIVREGDFGREVAEVWFRSPGDWRYEVKESSNPDDVGRVSVVLGSRTDGVVVNPEARRDHRLVGTTVQAKRKAFVLSNADGPQGKKSHARVVVDAERYTPLKLEEVGGDGKVEYRYEVTSIEYDIPIDDALFRNGVPAGEG